VINWQVPGVLVFLELWPSEDAFSNQAIAHDAFRSLVNLSDSPIWVTPLSEESFLVFLVSYILVSSYVCRYEMPLIYL
jgi:hypothetical protein